MRLLSRLTAPARLHPTSRTILGFYSLTNAYETTELMGRLAAYKGRTELRADMLSQSVAILRYTVSNLGPAGILIYAPDFITFQIAKAAYLLAKVGRHGETLTSAPVAHPMLTPIENV